MVQQDIALAQAVQDVLAGRQRGAALRDVRRELQRVVVDFVDHRRQPHDVHRPGAAVEVVGVERELREQEIGEVVRAIGGDLEPQRQAERPMRELALQRVAQVLDVVFVELEVGVARQPELRVRHDVATREEVVQVRMHDRRQQHEGMPRLGDLDRHLDDPRQDARRLDDRDPRLPPERIAAGELDDEVEALVDDLRPRMGRVEADGRQHGTHFAREIIGGPGRERRRAIDAVDQAHAVCGERRQDVVVEDAVLVVDQLVQLAGDRRVARAQRLRCRVARGGRQVQLLAQAGDANLEELVDVVADDTEIAKPLEQRHVRIDRHRQHAAIEGDQRQFAIDARIGRRRRRGIRRRHRDDRRCEHGTHGEGAVDCRQWP